ncbi:MAG: UvrD-helicase domain-containing protein [Verrucomicrobiota bacterium]
MVGINGLNDRQREAVLQTDGPLLILAGAGKGKTRVITTRIAYLLSQGVPPNQILAVTFTNKAAAEMRERVAKDQGKAAPQKWETNREEDVIVSTFHSLCVRMLREDITQLGYKQNFGIYTGPDQLGLVRKLVVEVGGKDCGLEPKAALGMIGWAKNRGLSPRDIEDEMMAAIAQAYNDELVTLNAVDFDDLLILGNRLLGEFREVREKWQRRFRFVMVDEFQDTNSLQMSLLRNLVGPEKNVCVVGDDDQSIYGWRGAEISNILDFESFFPQPHIVKLEENYRCTQPILGLANSIIRHNQNRRAKTLWCSKESAQLVRMVGMPGAEEEAEWIVGEMQHVRQVEQRSWEDFAILFRTNVQSRVLEQKMREADIPYRVVGGQSFFDRREVKDLISYLSVLMNPDDDLNLARVMNTPPRGIGQTAISAARTRSVEMGGSMWAALQDEEFLASRTTRGRNAITSFVDLITEYRSIATTPSADYAAMANNLLKEIGYVGYVRKSCKSEEESLKREESIREFIDSMYTHRAKRGRKSKGLQHFLDDVALSSDKEEEDISKKQGVCLITLHAAKGLEFPVVYLVGLEEGTLPHSRSLVEGTRDEERRLLYVGITRAKESLTLTLSRNPARLFRSL